jgi:GTPase involved in cell partitioning and DNA repair
VSLLKSILLIIQIFGISKRYMSWALVTEPWHLQAELEAYAEELLRRPAIIVANKIDLLENPDLCIARLKEATSLPIVPVSGLAGQGISDLRILLRGLSPSDRLLHSDQQR